MKNMITIEQLETLLEQQNDVRIKNLDKQFSIAIELEFVMDDIQVEQRITGYNVSIDDGVSIKSFTNKEDLLFYLQRKKVLINGEAELVDISYRWKTYDEYIEDVKFRSINMKELLEKYKDADMFSLTGQYNNGYTEEHPFGEYGIDDKTANNALSIVKQQTYKNLRNYYANFTEKEKKLLPSFEELIADIEKESSEYFDLFEKGNIPSKQSPFLSDLMYEGKTKYKNPQNIWHFYHDIYDGYFHYGKAISEMQKNKLPRDLMDIFENPYYQQLKQSLQKTEVTFTWHCTTSSMLSVVYYFKVDRNSLAWLSMLKDDYDMKELDDLAFYKDGKVIFSSCTHEHFHNDISAE